MNKFARGTLLVALALVPLSANAATISYGSVTIAGPASTGGSCSAFPALTTPVAANTPLCQITVLPAGWTGVVANPSGGADSADFAVVSVNGVPTLENVVALTNTGSAAGNGTYAIGASQVTP